MSHWKETREGTPLVLGNLKIESIRLVTNTGGYSCASGNISCCCLRDTTDTAAPVYTSMDTETPPTLTFTTIGSIRLEPRQNMGRSSLTLDALTVGNLWL